jgi:protein-tyrosine phosphatase
MMSHRLLFVCAANVCRSPLMAFSFAEALADDSDRTGWTVSSRGTSVVNRDAMCEVSASLITGSEAGAAFAASHVSAPVVASHLATQDMILVATRAERAKVAQINPALRERTFTVREAIALGRTPATAAELDQAARMRTSNQRVRLAGYPQLLHLRRGTVGMPVARPPLPFFGRQHANPIDIPDVHHEKLKNHEAKLRESQADVRTLHGQIREYLASRVSVG